MFISRVHIDNIKDIDEPIDVYSVGGATHCRTAGTLKNIREVYLHKNGLENIPSYTKVIYKHNITYDDVRDIFTLHKPYKRIYFQRIKRELYYHNCKLNGKKRDVTFVPTL